MKLSEIIKLLYLLVSDALEFENAIVWTILS